jgi:hypothetical protein
LRILSGEFGVAGWGKINHSRNSLRAEEDSTSHGAISKSKWLHVTLLVHYWFIPQPFELHNDVHSIVARLTSAAQSRPSNTKAR